MRVRISNMVLQRGVSAALVVAATWPAAGWARSRGIMATACSGCHGGAEAATVTARFEPEFVEPGETGTILIEVSASGIAEAGLAIFSVGGGTFSVPQGQPLTASGDWVTHNQAKAASGGRVEFRVDWTAPANVGVALFEIAALATNGNNAVNGDKPGGTNLTVGHGCAPVKMYYDSDGDGYGREDSWIASCGNDDGYVAVFGDCADSDPMRNPDAVEVCNGLDDDCDGEVDEDVVAGFYYRDVDGDGFGDPKTATETCTPEPGYVPNGDDCDDRAANNHPDGVEICDYVDNDCDGRIDEGLRPTCGLGLCMRVSDVCDSDALCTPGEPFPEVCNGLDDDCDGEIDEEGCPEGQQCLGNTCVDEGSVPSTPPVPVPVPGGDPPAPPSPGPGAPAGPTPTATSTQPDPSASAPDETQASPGVETAKGEPSNAGCIMNPGAVTESGRIGKFGVISIALAFVALRRRRKS